MAFALTLGGASTATAGGLTSLLIVAPQSRETASLYYSDEEYVELQRLLGPPGRGTRTKPPEADLVAARQINVTWLQHDISPWRLDQIFPEAGTKDVWIHTADHLPESMNGHWHRTENPTRLRSLLADLGVTGEISEGRVISAAPEPDARPAQDSASAPRASAADEGVQWWWTLPGLVAGGVLALVLRPFALRMRWARLRREPGPRQELRDV